MPRSCCSPTELRQKLYAVVREVALGENQYLVMPGDADDVVIISRADYNALLAERNLLRELRQAEADSAAGRTSDGDEVRAFVAKRARAKRTVRRRSKGK